MDIYVKPFKKISVAGAKTIRITDVAEVYAPPDLSPRLNKIVLLELNAATKKNYLVSVIDLIETIARVFPKETLHAVGEQDTVIEYTPKEKKPNPFWQWTKVAFISLLLLSGSATAVMSFHSDSQVPLVFQNYYTLFFDETAGATWWIDLPYSIGLAVGIIVFFNHFAGKKITDEPTPIEVEMALYDEDVTTTVIEQLSTERKKDESLGS